MVCGGISYEGHTELHIFQRGNLNARRYVDYVLHPIVRPYLGAMGDGAVLMDDNPHPHRARLVDQYLDREAIDRMDWPARSPDLNPIEHA